MTFQQDPAQPIPTQPTQKLYYVAPTPPPGPKKRNWITSKPVIGIAALILGIMLGSAGASGPKGGSAASLEAMPQVTVTATATETATYEAEEPAEPTVEPTEEPTEEPTQAAPPAPAKKSYKEMSSRGFKLMAKDPDAYIGKTYILYGEITQFDSATGAEAFLAYMGAKKLRISYGYVDYPQNSLLRGTEAKLKKLVEGDCFKAKVTVNGSYSYDTQAGGNTTVPELQVDWIDVYGSTD